MISHVFVDTPLLALLTLSTSEYAIDCDVPLSRSFKVNETGSTAVM